MSSISCILLLPIPFTPSIFPSIASCSKQSVLRICPIQLVFLFIQYGPFLADSSHHFFVCYFMRPFNLLNSPPAPHLETLLIVFLCLSQRPRLRCM
uniref:Putative secreted protein n=1 Tax=Xenopsylla cheopis TaxID=163159 RepID=A0A6M2DZJ6_XENCH